MSFLYEDEKFLKQLLSLGQAVKPPAIPGAVTSLLDDPSYEMAKKKVITEYREKMKMRGGGSMGALEND